MAQPLTLVLGMALVGVQLDRGRMQATLTIDAQEFPQAQPVSRNVSRSMMWRVI